MCSSDLIGAGHGGHLVDPIQDELVVGRGHVHVSLCELKFYGFNRTRIRLSSYPILYSTPFPVKLQEGI